MDLKKMNRTQLSQLLQVTNMIAGSVQAAAFANDRVTDANRAEVLREAEASARAYAASRNKQGTSPRAHSSDESSIVSEVMAWVARRRVRGHGKRKK